MARRWVLALIILPIVLATGGILSLLYLGIFTPQLPFIQTVVSTQANADDNGAFWGVQTPKVVLKGDFVCTYALENTITPRKTFLYSHDESGVWQQGYSNLLFSRPPSILIDSKGIVHLIGYVPFDTAENEGWIMHYNFTTPYDITTAPVGTNVTANWKANGNYGPESYSSYYVGAGIGEDDTILVAYTNSINNYGISCLGAKIFNTTTKSWEFSSISTTLPSRYCYPLAFVTANYFHVLAIEDEEDHTIPGDHPFRFGAVKHFQRARTSSSWQETTLIDLNPHYTSMEIEELDLQHCDLYVDSSGLVHAIVRYGPFVRHYYKVESASTWQEDAATVKPFRWVKLWERSDGKLFMICANFRTQITLIPFGSNKEYIISSLTDDDRKYPVPFIANLRSGSLLSAMLEIVIFSDTLVTPTISLSVDTSEIT